MADDLCGRIIFIKAVEVEPVGRLDINFGENRVGGRQPKAMGRRGLDVAVFHRSRFLDQLCWARIFTLASTPTGGAGGPVGWRVDDQ